MNHLVVSIRLYMYFFRAMACSRYLVIWQFGIRRIGVLYCIVLYCNGDVTALATYSTPTELLNVKARLILRSVTVGMYVTC